MRITKTSIILIIYTIRIFGNIFEDQHPPLFVWLAAVGRTKWQKWRWRIIIEINLKINYS